MDINGLRNLPNEDLFGDVILNECSGFNGVPDTLICLENELNADIQSIDNNKDLEVNNDTTKNRAIFAERS